MSLLVEQKRRVLHITLNRPEKRNALTLEMCRGILEAVDSAQGRSDIGAIMICAVGQVFCSGIDLDEAAPSSSPEAADVHDRFFSMGFDSRKPIVISVNGAALGGGLGLVTQGHVVLAEQSSVFSLPEIRIGLWPFLVYRAVEQCIGGRRTLALSLSGRNFHSQEALAWGLVHKISPDDEVNDRAVNLARDIAKSSPRAIEAGMTYARDIRGKDWHYAGKLGAELRDELMKSDDFQEGISAFKQKREPQWPSIPAEFYSHKQHSH